MTYLRLIYISQPVDFSPASLADILAEARRGNREYHITGALVSRADVFVQLLEGSPQGVDAIFGRIQSDPRHRDIRVLVRRPTSWRLFPDWSMLDAKGRSWLWSPQEVASGVPACTPKPEIEAMFVRLWRESVKKSMPRFTLRFRSRA